MRKRLVLCTGVGTLAVAAGVLAVPSESRADHRGTQEARVELGRRLFLDPTISRSGKFSCASCHEPEHGFSDPRVLSEDDTGRSLRHSQPLTDLKGRGFHWDGEFDTVRQLLVARLAPQADVLAQTRDLLVGHFNASKAAGDAPDEGEFNRKLGALTPPYYGPVTPSTPTPDVMALDERINSDGRYAALYTAAYGGPQATHESTIEAMNAFVLSLRTERNAYDRHLLGEENALSASARRGLDLFEGRAACSNCHTTGMSPDGARLTDGQFHNTGVAFRRIAARLNGAKPDGGAFTQTFVPSQLGSFKTPSLRDVARRAPYMHDGSFATLADVVDYYDRGGTSSSHTDPHVRDLALSVQDKADLVAFLESLTGETRPGLALPPKDLGHPVKVRLVDLEGRPVKGFTFEVAPSGDRFAGIERPKTTRLVRTDDKGEAVFPFPATTHAALSAPNHEIGLSRALPDCVTETELMVTPRDKVSLRILSDRELGPTLLALPDVPTTNEVPGQFLALFKKVRTLRSGDAIYVADAPAKGKARLALLRIAEGARTPLVEIDFTGGATETLDLRTIKLPPVVPPRRPEPPGGGGDGLNPGNGGQQRPGSGVK